MSGHSKWSKIKREKEAKDKQKGNVFSKLSRLVTLAVIEGGGSTDPENNLKLRLAIEKAKNFNLPKDNIERAIERGIGPDRQQLKEIIYEAFAPSGIALIILATTDNLNRTLSEIRNVLDSHGGKLGDKGSVIYLFKKCGLANFKTSKVTEEAVFGFSDKIGAFDIDKEKDYFFVNFPYENIGRVKDFLNGLKVESVEIEYKPQSIVEIRDKNLARKTLKLIEEIENLDDVQKVFANFDIPDELLQ